MNQLKKLFAVAALTACVLPVAAQYPVIPDSVKIRGEEQQKEIDRKSDEAWAKALPVVMSEAAQGRPYKPWASKPEDLIKSNIPAFPGAEGGGAYTPGGRGGKVIVVNSLADSGPGTLREACETGGARIVVFNVSGVIRLKTPINVRAPYITIAGQTAPGDGVCVTGASFLLDTHDIIIRHMRFRRGAQDVFFRDDALGGNCVGNVIIDHCSASWGLDENMSVYRHVYNRDSTGHGLKLPTVNITIQNSIFSEALDCYNHAFGATIGGHNSMFCRNLFASNISRNCSIGMNEDFNLVNNVTFNWWNRSVDGGDETSRLNIINNYFKPGPITPKDKPIAHRIVKPESSRDKKKPDTFGKAYVAGNVVEGNARVTKNNWDGGVQDCLNTMKVMGAQVAFLPLGGIKEDWTVAGDARQELVSRLHEVGEMAVKDGVVIGIRTPLDAGGDIKLLKEINSKGIKIYYSFQNALENGRDLCKELKKLGKDRICQIHCTDTDGVTLPYNTRLDMNAVKHTLDKMGWSGWLVIERSRNKDEVRNVKKNFGTNVAYLKQIFQQEK